MAVGFTTTSWGQPLTAAVGSDTEACWAVEGPCPTHWQPVEAMQYLTSDQPQAPYREAGETSEMSEGAVASAVHRLRQRYGRCLRAGIVETVADPAEVDDELRHMLAIVRA